MLGVSHVVIQFPLYEQAKIAMAKHRNTPVNQLGLLVSRLHFENFCEI